jgi:hypothetical protein
MIELLVVAGLLGGITLTVFLFFRQSQKTGTASVANKFSLQMDARKGADVLLSEIRTGTNIVKPRVGETAPYLVFRNMVNRMTILFLEKDEKNSEAFKKEFYRLREYVSDYSGVHKPDQGRILLESVRRVSFTTLSPSSVQMTLTMGNETQDFQFITSVGFMNVGDIE